MAAGGSPSIDPKLPWPSISGTRMEKPWAMRTMASYTARSPWGWYLPMTSPTTRADFRKPRFQSNPFSFIEWRIRRCTGLSPSRTSGSARDDHAHGVIEVGAFHLLLDRHRGDVERRWRGRFGGQKVFREDLANVGERLLEP